MKAEPCEMPNNENCTCKMPKQGQYEKTLFKGILKYTWDLTFIEGMVGWTDQEIIAIEKIVTYSSHEERKCQDHARKN